MWHFQLTAKGKLYCTAWINESVFIWQEMEFNNLGVDMPLQKIEK